MAENINDKLARLDAAGDKAQKEYADAIKGHPELWAALQLTYKLAKGLAPVGAGLVGGPGAAAIVATGIRLVEAAGG